MKIRGFLGFENYEWKMIGQVAGLTALFLGVMFTGIVIYFKYFTGG